MTTLGLTAVLSFLAPGAETYAAAHKATTQTGQPMVVMVSAEWCTACKTMEREVIPEVRRMGLLQRVSYAKVDLDKERNLGRKLTRGGPIPQLIMYRRTGRGWLRRRLIGRQSTGTVKAFIDEGVRLDQAAKKSETTKDTAKET